ncbi:hypothetical protein EV1_045373 [Malus domestica]
MHQNTSSQDSKEKRPKFFIKTTLTSSLRSSNASIDGPSLGVAACVCHLWSTVARNDTIWEHLCFRHVSSPPPCSVRPVVVALGGYKRLYRVCMRPFLSRLSDLDMVKLVWTRDEVQLSLLLFCVDYYERSGRLGGDSSALSLMFI